MSKWRFIILFVVVLLITTGTKAQESLNYFFRHITQSDGLLNNQVLSITQDGKGFIWVATPSGLQRYDGSRFIYYPEMLSSPAEKLTDGADIYADKKSNLLWITNSINLEKMELGKNHFTQYEHNKLIDDPSFTFDSYRDVKNAEWKLGANASYYYDSLAKKYVHTWLNIFPSKAHQASFIASDSISNITWVATPSQLLLFDGKTKKVYSDNFNPAHHPLLQPSSFAAGRFIRFVMMDSRQNIWVTGWGDILYKYDNKTKEVRMYSISVINPMAGGQGKPATAPIINCMMEDDNHTVWIGTENAGLLRYNPAKDNFDYIIAQDESNESIQYDYDIFCLFQDKEQNIWIGTDKGINIFNPYRQYFRSLRHNKNNPLTIDKNEITSFIQTTGGDMFVGTWGGGITMYDSLGNFKKISFLTD
jgi:ligand-binding sensor domain-containing protein